MGSPSPSSQTSVLRDLAMSIEVHAKTLDDGLQAHGLLQPSFDVDGPVSIVPKTAPKTTQSARVAVAEAAFKLFNLVTGPNELLLNMTANYHTMFALQWLIRFDIFTYIPLDGSSTSYEALTTAASVPESLLRGVARMAMTSSILSEPTPGHVAHTAASAMFVRQPHTRSWAEYMFGSSVPTAAAMVRQTERWPGSLEKTETAYNIAFNHGLPFFDHLSQSPLQTRQFAGYMKAVADSQSLDLAHLVNGFDWAALPRDALVVDVGGSAGHASLAIAKAYPHLRFEVQDLDAVVSEKGGSDSDSDKTKVTSVTFKSHDFFEPQPTQGAAVYLLRMIMHDWPDAEAASILKNLVPAMEHPGDNKEEEDGDDGLSSSLSPTTLSGGSKMVIMDTVMPAPGTIPAVRERVLRTRDLTMRQVFNARERGLEDWQALLQAADARFRLREVRQPEGSNMSLLTVELEVGACQTCGSCRVLVSPCDTETSS